MFIDNLIFMQVMFFEGDSSMLNGVVHSFTYFQFTERAALEIPLGNDKSETIAAATARKFQLFSLKARGRGLWRSKQIPIAIRAKSFTSLARASAAR